jgi:hypothetical protein
MMARNGKNIPANCLFPFRGAARNAPEIAPPPPLLAAAKQFLCWDRFPDLAIQLIRLDGPVGYWFPPSQLHTIVVFYTDREVEKALFLLFHEVGHFLEWEPGRALPADGREEIRAWERGREELERFLESQGLDPGMLGRYDRYARVSLGSYGVDGRDYLRPPD